MDFIDILNASVWFIRWHGWDIFKTFSLLKDDNLKDTLSHIIAADILALAAFIVALNLQIPFHPYFILVSYLAGFILDIPDVYEPLYLKAIHLPTFIQGICLGVGFASIWIGITGQF